MTGSQTLTNKTLLSTLTTIPLHGNVEVDNFKASDHCYRVSFKRVDIEHQSTQHMSSNSATLHTTVY